MALNERSKKALVGVHPQLIKVVELAHDLALQNDLDFIITEGCRTLATQRTYVAKGVSQTLKSRHIPGPDGYGKAVDFAPVIDTDGDGDAEVTFAWPAFHPIAECFKTAAATLQVPIVWGGDWKSFKDGPHIELDRKKYP